MKLAQALLCAHICMQCEHQRLPHCKELLWSVMLRQTRQIQSGLCPQASLGNYLSAECIPSIPSTLKGNTVMITVQKFSRPDNKHVKRWPVVSAYFEGFSLTKYSDGTLHFFHENSSGYVMLTRHNQDIYESLRRSVYRHA